MAFSKRELGHSKRYRFNGDEGRIYVHKYMHSYIYTYMFVYNYIYGVLPQTFHSYILSCAISW